MKNREEIAQALAASGYIADGELATAISLMQLFNVRCCWKARRASARPRWQRRWPRCTPPS